MAKRKARPEKGHERQLVEEMLGSFERQARVQAERNARGRRALDRFEHFAPLLLQALDDGGETAARAAIAFYFCSAGNRQFWAEEMAGRRRGADRSKRVRAERRSNLVARFEKAEKTAPNRSKIATARILARAELGEKASEEAVEKKARSFARRIREARRPHAGSGGS